MPENVGWKDAIRQVLEKAGGPLHYAEIARQIAESGLKGTDLGATPASTVSSQITTSIQRDPASPFIRVGRGLYALRNASGGVEVPAMEGPAAAAAATFPAEQTETTGLVNAMGMFWNRSKVKWNQSPSVLGRQQSESTVVDFSQQRGVYLLHDHQGTVYVGRITEQGLGRRLWQHTIDRLNSRWDRFSWFVVYPVGEDGGVHTTAPFNVDINTVIITMEAVLIESLEPRQNRKRGDDFQAVEFIQVEDPDIERDRKAAMVRELAASYLGDRR